MLQAGTPVAATVPSRGAPPCMVAIGDAHLNVVVYVDQVPLFTGPMSEAVLVLLASYFVFKVNWPRSDKLPTLLLASVVVPEKMAHTIVRFKTVLSALEEMKLTPF